jgi:MFS family permease
MMPLRSTVLWLSVAQLVSWGSLYYTFSLLLQPLETEFGFSRAQSSFAFSVALLVDGVCAYFVGRLIDKGFGRTVMLFGSLLAGAVLLLHSFMSSGFQFYILWAALGVAFACTFYAPAFAILTRRFPEDYRRAITGLTFLGGLASTVFIPLTAWLIRDFGWRYALQVLAALHLLLCVPIHWWVLRSPPATHKTETVQPEIRLPLKQFIWTPTFLCLAGFMLLSNFVTSGLPAHLIPMLRERGLPEATVLLVPASIGALQVVGRLLLFFFEKHADIHASNRWIVMLLPVGLGILVISGSNTALMMLFACVFGMGNGLATIVKGTAMATYVNREQVASLNGVLGIPNAISRSAAPFVLGALWTQSTGYRPGLILMVVASAVAAGFFIIASRRSLI